VSCDKTLCSTYATFAASPGEANTLTVTADGAAVTFLDTAPITPGKGCAAIAGGARCLTGSAPLNGLEVTLSDRDDVATVNVNASVHGGAGHDRITGSGFLSGGPGSDELTATARTTFADEDGDRPVADRYVGSPALGDRVSYAGRRTDVDIDLRRSGNAGDVFSGIESAEGGDGNDRLVGTGGPNELGGGPGVDRLTGLAGEDSLDGNGQQAAFREPAVERDRLYGGAGDDSLSGGELAVGGPGDDRLYGGHRLECGAGKDEASTPSGTEVFVRSDCESVSAGDHSDLVLRAPSAGAFLINRECYCRYAKYEATVGKVVVARATMRHKNVGYKHWKLGLRLNAQGRRLLAERGRLRITIRIREIYEIGYGDARERFRTDLVAGAR
jgi:Ca2+-binding RTX toxin-like protein